MFVLPRMRMIYIIISGLGKHIGNRIEIRSAPPESRATNHCAGASPRCHERARVAGCYGERALSSRPPPRAEIPMHEETRMGRGALRIAGTLACLLLLAVATVARSDAATFRWAFQGD